MLVALTSAEAETKPAAAVAANKEAEKKADENVEASANGETAKPKRGLHASLGDYASFGGHGESYAHTDFGHGGGFDFGGHADFGHGGYGHGGYGHGGYGHGFEGHDFGASEHHHEHVKHITVEKKIPVPYTITKHVPVTIEKKVPYEVKVPIPQPYVVEKVR